MDPLNIRIIEALQKRGNLTHAELADIVGSTPSTCLRRVRELRKSGVLAQSTYLASAAKLGRGLKALITVTTRDHTRRDRDALAKSIKAEPAISSAYGVTGELDAILIGNFHDMVEYQEVCDRLFDGDEKVVRYTTHFISETYKDQTAIPCDILREQAGAGG
ncbi:transcriptional regulator, AsnC family [Sulfitobacter marinus]|uniref:Transcriptional regulator, AsnC family n=1 Tax=Sulfitobacter marinus TaxID=394264 RepID=A0A1I6VRI6_9RHOB|nr:Lrp/AsnC family transcriptional regulator [Sulfitobacter marinus]SFT16297.1 transcriptional regulator, AsnC family [Sulfitobacter marinus]